MDLSNTSQPSEITRDVNFVSGSQVAIGEEFIPLHSNRIGSIGMMQSSLDNLEGSSDS